MITRLIRLVVLVAAFGAGAASPVLAQNDAERAIGSRLPQDYVSLRDRPLFAPDRRPPAPPVVEAPPPAPEAPPPEPAQAVSAPHWELIGVVRSSRITSAIFRSPAEAAFFNLRQGESRDGWTLVEVGRFDVSLRNGDGRAKMRFPEGAAGNMGLPPGGMPSMPGDVPTRVVDDQGNIVVVQPAPLDQ